MSNNVYQEVFDDDDVPSDLDVAPTTYANVLSDDEDRYSQEGELPEVSLEEIKRHIPDQVVTFLTHFQRHVYENNAHELYVSYEFNFNRLTERFFAKQAWPDPQHVTTLLGDEGIFLTLYRELYYRHIYARLQPTLEDRFHSYENYCDLFNFILNSDGPVNLELPNQWLWDIVDEFIYQFQAFCTYRNRYKRKLEEELYLLKENPQMWSCYSVLNVLYSLMQKSNITEQLLVTKNGGDLVEAAGEYGARPLYKMLGYFSIIGLLRVHCMLGDYTMALRMMDNIEMNNKAIFTRVTACHVTTYYYVGFAYMMMRRYSDAIKAFSHILTFVARTKQYHARTYHYQTLNKQSEQMYSLLAICVTMCPTRLDEMLHSHLRDKYTEQQQKMHQGGEEALLTFEDLFMFACPKFVTANPPNYDEIIQYLQNKKQAQLKNADNKDNSGAESDVEDDDHEEIQAPNLPEPSRHQAAVFLSEARYQLLIPALRSYLRLYSTMEVEKLATFLEINDVQHLRQQLLIFKLRSRQKKWVSGTLLEGTYSPAFDLDFYLCEDVVHIAEYKVGRRYADWFIRHINKLEDNMSNSLKNSKSQHNAASSKSSASKEGAVTQKAAEAISLNA